MGTNWNKHTLKKVFTHIDESWEGEVSFLQKMGQFPSTLGNEAPIQEFMAQFFKNELGLVTESIVPDVEKISKLPGYSPPEWTYENRPVVIGTWKSDGPKEGKSLILQGHVDVVSAEPASLWNYDPWGATIVGDKMYGRGIQDMKSGIAAFCYALKAIKECGIELGADVILESVIEEECTGNGALTTLAEGYIADGALIPEPFGLVGLKAQVGVIWLRIKVTGSGAHVERADRAVNAIEKAYVLIEALQTYRKHINSQPKHPDFSNVNHPLNVNIGMIHSGDWPSNVPSECTIEARVGFYPGEDPQKIKDEVKAFLLEEARKDEWLRNMEPQITFYGFHAAGVSLDTNQALFKTLEMAHERTTGEKMDYTVITATTDIRLYNLYYDIPTTCYGPVGDNMHGADEWVDLNSVKEVTKTYAAFILDWCGVRAGSSQP
ncbi:ArgE/DapE family deacylase [Paenisporosarcina antarctica]|uniref:ArgE/DapE family deacylase n=1 Tax=Paenisporosarcina antarctica TaxID=417367 RepID=A0A4P7A0I8_9BACL|nr:ArgE/DapE family deacylase [Paenisporosarcina antarctica]QBP42500.1 ArgE/DapE family deacylase [Paenisporosarcina antarctica]